MPQLPQAAARSITLAAIAAPLFTSCIAAHLEGAGAPTIGASAAVSTAYWFRGAPANVNNVVQADLGISVPLKDGSTLGFSTWANLDLSDDTGDAFSNDGNGSHFTEVDYVVDYSRSFEGFDAAVGFVSYNFPNFVGRSTSEAYLGLATSLGGFDQGLTLYYDTDLLQDAYVSLSASKAFVLSDTTTGTVSVLAGYMGKDQASFYFGNRSSGFSDVALSASVDHTLDRATTLFGSINAVEAVGSAFENALDSSGVDSSGVWFNLGLAWSF